MTPAWRVLLIAGCLVTPASAQTTEPQSTMPGMADGHAMPGMQGPAERDMMAGMTKMNEAMKAAPMTGDADHDFVSMMIPHHQGAVDMAEVELKHGKDPAMRRLAAAIVAAQHKEIAEMRRWQAKHPSP